LRSGTFLSRLCEEPPCAAGEHCVHFTNDPVGVGECTPDWHGDPLSLDAGLDAGSCR